MPDRVVFDGGTIAVEYQLATNMVVFSHDFATQRDNEGLFRDIANNLPAGYGYVLFDYYDVDEKQQTVQIKTFAEQLERLQAVLNWLQQHQDVKSISVIAQSLGCIVAAKLHSTVVQRMILLAPPLNLPLDFQHYTTLAGAQQKNGIWLIKRPDSLAIGIPQSFFVEIKQRNANAILMSLAAKREYDLLLPNSDEVLPDTDYTDLITSPNVHVEVVDNADHNFEGQGRSVLIEIIRTLLTAQKQV